MSTKTRIQQEQAATEIQQKWRSAELEVKTEVGSVGFAVITISNPPVNAFSVLIIAWLKEKIEQAMSRNDVKAIVFTGNLSLLHDLSDYVDCENKQVLGKMAELLASSNANKKGCHAPKLGKQGKNG
ncbi:hypothetical protein L2E82_33857 [Cichorium intybus]|uniref:Uncharacterized protein n=1 Tax=Cichorium intybus TaxID=13427 RepID=A0ACB9BL60_CICIN|nr:hypothetical protein L2E82_33857 [Cichorium intybus]